MGCLWSFAGAYHVHIYALEYQAQPGAASKDKQRQQEVQEEEEEEERKEEELKKKEELRDCHLPDRQD
ncbi:hypothetical protein ACLKA6_017195 [Drosophila palustris]